MSSSAIAGEGRVVVTGLGAVSACGWGAESLWRELVGGETRLARPRRFDTSGQRTHVAGEVPDPAPDVAAEVRDWPRLSQADRFAVAAAIEAAGEAGLGLDEPGLGVFFGSSTAGMLEGEEFYGRILGSRSGRPALRLLTSQQINGPGDAVARLMRATGPVHTVSSACSSGALAVGEALRALRAGEVEIAVTGGADSLCRLTYSGFNSLRAVDDRPCRPFRGDRGGLSLGEGAGVLVLEPLERALERGARPLAELLGIGASCDSYHMTAPHPDGEGAARAISRALEDASLGADQVTFVNAHGTGTPLNDASEWNALRRVFGERAGSLPTTSIKGALGHLLGSSGAIEAVATVQSLEAGLIPPTPGDGELDPDLDVDLVRGEPRRFAGPAIAISTSFAFGGANAALLFARWLDEGGILTAAARVVITGLGTVTAAGFGSEALAEQLRDSRPRLSEIDRSGGFHTASGRRLAARVEAPNFLPWLSPMAARRMSRPSKFAVVAAKLALEDAGLSAEEMDQTNMAVGLATAFGPTDFSERIVKCIFEESPEATSPALFTESVANAPAAQVALAIKALGSNITVTQREAGPLIAVASIAREVASGRSRVGLAGAVDEVNPILHAVLDRFGALAGPGEDGSETARPFDRRRDGFNLAEGATVVVLESEERARQRGARPLARVRLSLAGFDPDAPVSGWSRSPDILAGRLGAGLARAGIAPGEIDRIVSSASGSRAGDRLEGLVLRSLWREAATPPILAPKGVVGEYAGGHLAAAVLAAAGRPFGPTAGFSEPDPEIGITPHDGSELPRPASVLVSSLAAGGAAAWAVFEAEDT